ncbi:MAG: penicillin-binding protein 2 [Muribaculum sp.]|nr:penicillin-binding protein 2 [Muribaculum sp.]
MQKKLVVLFILVLLAFAGLSVNLFYLVKNNETTYQKQVLSQQISDSKTIPYRRGDIVDAKGTILATSEKVYNLQLDSYIMHEKEDYMEPTMEALAACFPQLDMKAVREYLESHLESRYYIALRQLTFDEITPFKEAQNANKKIQGVYFEEEYKRVYPNNSMAADVIGFTRSDDTGLYGLEEYYNDTLSGTPGREYGYLNESDEVERTVKQAINGNTIHSTIDINVQNIVEKNLQEFNETNKDKVREGNGAESAACIMMRVNTGEILAMASYPTFNLNDVRNKEALLGSVLIEQYINENGYTVYKNTHTPITQEVLDSMDDDQVMLNLNNLWKNYCISNTYEPGSTAKPFTVAAALETGAIQPTDSFECYGNLEVGGHTIACHTKGGEGIVTVQDSIAWSCNVALMKIGARLGKEEFSRFQNIFNFGLKTNIDLAGEARTASLLFPKETMGPADLATNSFGQNFNVTMIQMITGYCSLINGGYYYEPHMVNKITNSSGAVVENIEPRVLKQTVSESTSELIRQYCRAVVMEEGGARRTGKTARPAGYAIGGKTGTAETLPRDNGQYVVSFIGYAPADDPQVAIYVVVDRPNASDQADAKFATGIVRNILTEALPYLNIFMTEELDDTEVTELTERQLAITTMYAAQLEEEERQRLAAAEAEMALRDEGLDPNIGDDPGVGEVLGDSPDNPNLSGDNQVQEPSGNSP